MVGLHDYQTRYVNMLPARVIMAAQTGTGKTYMAMAHYRRYGHNAPILLLAPSAKLRTDDWSSSFNEFFGKNAPAVDYLSYQKLARHSLRTIDGRKWIYETAAKIARGDLFVIADEAHYAKNSQSNVGLAIYRLLSEAPAFALLTATPLGNGWIDAVNYFKIWGFTKNKTSFYQKYVAIDRSRGFPIIRGYFHASELERSFAEMSYQLSAPVTSNPTRQLVRFTRPRAYDTLRAKRIDPKTGDPITSVSKLFVTLRQTLTTSDKLDYLRELAEGTRENITVFYNFTSERQAILSSLTKTNKRIIRQDGEIHDVPAKSEWPTVTNSVTVTQYKSGSTAIELTYSNITVFFSPTYSITERTQAEGRTDRSGQSRHLTYYDLVTTGTVESAALRALQNKHNFVENIEQLTATTDEGEK